MFVNRVTGTPTDAQIRELEQVIIVEKDAPSSVAGVGQTVIVVGEAVNDHGAPEVPRRLQAKGELTTYYGGFKDWIGSALDGFNGNLYAKLYPTRFADLVVIPVDMEAGEVTFSGSPTEDVTIPAGTRVSDGGTSIWATLEDLVFTATGYALSGTVRVRHVSGATSQLAAAVSTIVDSTVPDLSGFTVTNALAVTAADADTQYLAAIDAALDETSAAVDGTIIFSCRSSLAVIAKLKQHVIDASAAGRGRICVVSPVPGTTTTVAKSSAGLGAGVSRSDRCVYAFPSVQWLLPEYSTTDYVTTTFDAFFASVIASVPPQESPGQVSSYLSAIVGGEAGIVYGRTFYQEMKAAGIVSFNVDRQGNKCGYSAVTTSLTAGKEPIEQRRFSDYLQDSIAGYLASYKDKPLSEANMDGARFAIEEFLGGLVRSGALEADSYLVDVDSVNTPTNLALGIFYILVKVRRTPSAKYIVLLTQIGTSVVISEQ